jgi:hypothetical protein
MPLFWRGPTLRDAGRSQREIYRKGRFVQVIEDCPPVWGKETGRANLITRGDLRLCEVISQDSHTP